MPTSTSSPRPRAPIIEAIGAGDMARGIELTTPDLAERLSVAGTPEGPFIATAEEPAICQLDRWGSIDPRTFQADLPANPVPLTLDELRRAGPLGGRVHPCDPCSPWLDS